MSQNQRTVGLVAVATVLVALTFALAQFKQATVERHAKFARCGEHPL
jgi:hypothetical protein